MSNITIPNDFNNDVAGEIAANMAGIDQDYEYLARDLNKAGYFVSPRRIVEDREKSARFGAQYKLEGNIVASPVKHTDDELRARISNSTDRDFEIDGIGGKTIITLHE